jgi:aspartate kinase
MLLTAGERMSAALLAMAINDLGSTARSFTGSQAGVITTGTHGDARIIDITPGRIVSALAEGDVVIVAGFQGVSQTTKDITTLGRGASDTTAVALAAALDAAFCEIYSDVDGIFTADPRIVPGARQIPQIGYEDMLEMAANGAKILHLRCVEYARREHVAVHVRSSFSDKPGTWVRDINYEESGMEQPLIEGIAHDRSEAKITIVGVPDKIGEAADIFTVVAEADVNIDMIVQNVSREHEQATDISFTLSQKDGTKAINALRAAQARIGFVDVVFDDQVGKVSVGGDCTLLPRARRRRGQHRDDLHLRDSDLGRCGHRRRRPRGPRRPHRLRSGLRRPSRRLRRHRPLTHPSGSLQAPHLDSACDLQACRRFPSLSGPWLRAEAVGGDRTAAGSAG